ncbi:MAG: TMEM165/GDT1 family protein [Betaproteobacteria bacterium]|nr:TMEM165/GDT1 family protein [Betaproteobacteria bacterium]
MESLLVSTGVVALAEIGDKTQLLSFVLAARFKKPLPIILGILAATVINHGLAGALGAWITSTISPGVLRWVLGTSFITTLGMLIADVPAVFAGDKLANKIPMRMVHAIAAAVFALLGVATLIGAGSDFGF